MKIGIIGAGAIARRGHLPMYMTMPEVDVAAVADIDEYLAKKIANEFEIPAYFSDYRSMLEDSSIDMVDICAPTPNHFEIVMNSALAGKHILVEKPLTKSLNEALVIKETLEKTGSKLCVVQNWRYTPSLSIAKKRIENGYLGDIVTIHGLGLTTFPNSWTLNTWLYHNEGVLYDFGPHLIDLILYIKDFTKINRIVALGGDFSKGSMGFYNYSVINIEFDDGSIAVADISWITSAVFKLNLEIYGTGGSMIVDLRNDVLSETHGYNTPFDDTRFFVKKLHRIATGVVTGKYFKGPNLYYKPLILDFIKSIDGQNRVPVSIDQAIMTNAVLQAASTSMNERRSINIDEILNK